MSLTSQIGSSELAFKLSQKIVSALAEKFAFKFEDGWDTISSRPIENIQKRLKRDKRRANPTSSIKHQRTAFSFWTRLHRPVCQAAHPEATFGQLSRYVSEAWKALTPEKMAEFKELENQDKIRYQTERAALLAATPADGSVAVPAAAEPVKEKKVKAKAKAVTTPVAEAKTVEVVKPTSAGKVKSAKPAKAAAAAAPAAPATTEPAATETTKPAKVKSAKKEVEAATPAAPAAPAAAPVEKAAKPAKPTKAAPTPAAAAAAPAATPAAAPVKVAKPASAPKAAKAVKA